MTANEIRLLSLEAVHKAGKGHIGGVLSCAEILSVLYTKVLRPQDKFILSKGHCAVGLYAALTIKGDIGGSELMKMNRGGILGEHPSRGIPGVEVTSGSLGHGLGLACGMALANKLDGKDGRIYVLLGDGECWEGSVWEAAMFAAHHQLGITAIVDRNGYAVQGATEDIMALENLLNKWHSFGWQTMGVCGHNESELELATSMSTHGPIAVVASTIKGKGVSFMQGKKEWHHGSLSAEHMKTIREELRG